MIMFGDTAIDSIPQETCVAWVLLMNPMRANWESQCVVAVATSRDELVEYVRGEEVPTYQTEAPCSFTGNTKKFTHCYREGPLQWFNRPESLDQLSDSNGNGIVRIERSGWLMVRD